jgi:fatty-acyl-CoA synthase
VPTAFEVFWRQSTRSPQRVCLHLLHSGQPDRAIFSEELLSLAAGYAQAYEKNGIRPGEVVILIMQHGLDLVAAFWGAVLHGAVPSIMPFLTEKLLPERYHRDLALLVQITRPAAIVTYPDFQDELGGLDFVHPPLRALIVSSSVNPLPDPDPAAFSGRARDLDDIVFLQHSSGTTGLQKGVAITHRALLNQLASYSTAIQLTDRDVIISWLPLYHDMGLIAGFLLPFLQGIPLVLLSPFDWVKAPVRLLQAVTRYQGTLSWMPNFAYNFCAQKIRDDQLADIDLSSWRAVINCSEPMAVRSFELFAARFASCGFRPSALATSYAMAENVFGVTQGGIGEPVAVDEIDAVSLQSIGEALPARPGMPSARMLSCGKPIQGTQIRVLSPQGRVLQERQVGELVVRSDCMLAGYYNRPEESAHAFIDGWYWTGDLGYIAGGEVYVTGRKKDLLIVGGRNIFPQDLEALASEVPGVHPGRVAAFGIFNENSGSEEAALVAEVDLPEEQRGEEDACRALEDAIRLAVNRGSAVSLRYLRLVGPHWLVKTSSGKTARNANREKFLAELASGQFRSPCPEDSE